MKKITPQNIIFRKSLFAHVMLILLSVFSCASKKEISKTESNIEENTKLIFLNYILAENINGEKSIDFINKKITDGKIRNRNNKYLKNGTIGDLKCSQINDKSQILKSVFIKNPLLKTVEFVNDSLKFESKALKVKKSTLSLRLQLHANTTQIIIAEVIDSLQNLNQLHTTNLKNK